MTIQCSRTILVPSLYDAEWSRVTNQSLSEVFLCPVQRATSASWSFYAAQQHNTLARLHEWLKESSSKVDALFFVNLFKDYSQSLVIHFPRLAIAGIIHGCAADRAEPGATGRLIPFEKAIAETSILCVTSQHLLHKLQTAGYPLEHARITGLPLDVRLLRKQTIKEPRLCIFNHRLVSNKGVYQLRDVWNGVVAQVPNAKCIVTFPWADPDCLSYVRGLATADHTLEIAGVLPPEEYEALVGRASIGFSLATYENFGTSFAYSLLRQVCYFVPDRLSYPELAPHQLRYRTIDDLICKIAKALSDPGQARSLIDIGVELLTNKYGRSAFLNYAGFVND